jgi:LEA14-like dessication related protein
MEWSTTEHCECENDVRDTRHRPFGFTVGSFSLWEDIELCSIDLQRNMGAFVSKACRTAFKDPKVTLKGMSMKGANLLITLNIYNPNPFTLKIHTLTYRVSKAKNETVEIAAGELTEKDLAVPPNQTQEAQASMSISLGGIGAASRSIIQKGHTDFVVRGVLSIGGSSLKLLEFPYKLKGSVVLFGSKSCDSQDSGSKDNKQPQTRAFR